MISLQVYIHWLYYILFMLVYKKTINRLINKKISISVAESCTGGLLCSTLTKNSGISKIFNMGFITYSNKAKNLILKIPLKQIRKHGAVSEKVAYLMAYNLSKISKSDISISITGIAGPTGGTKLKPVGLVFIGIKFKKKIYLSKKRFKGSRENIQKKIVNCVFKSIYDLI